MANGISSTRGGHFGSTAKLPFVHAADPHKKAPMTKSEFFFRCKSKCRRLRVPESNRTIVMKSSSTKRILKWTAFAFLFLIAVLAIHIYVVMKPRVDAGTRVMTRIDIHEPVSVEEADSITAWLYRQQGVDHVMCNAATQIVVFTYSPLKANAGEIAGRFSTSLHYPHAVRYVPTQKELSGGCPVASTSVIYKAYAFFKNNF